MRFTPYPIKLSATRLFAGLAIAGGVAVLLGHQGVASAGNEVDWLSRLARDGDAGAQLQLGLAYLNGRYGMRPDAVTGRYWLSAAAEGGNAYAADVVANSYAEDSAVAFTRAVPWWRMAASEGNADAQLHLGEYLISNGHDRQALAWLRDAADRGEPRAHAELVSLYPETRLTEADLYRGDNRLAVVGERIDSPSINSLFAIWRGLEAGSVENQSSETLLSRAQQGDPVAEYQLAVRYRDGAWAVQRDPRQATLWLRRAAAAGNPLAEQELDARRNNTQAHPDTAPAGHGDGRV